MTASYVVGASSPKLLEISIGRALEDAAARWPDGEAVISVHQNLRLTYAELSREVDLVARGLLSLGLMPGDRVAIWAPNCVEWLLTQLATATVGIVLVNLNPAYRASEAEFVLRKTGARALITTTSFKTSDYLSMVEGMAVGPFSRTGSGKLSTVIKLDGEDRPGWVNFAALLQMAERTSEKDFNALRAAVDPYDAVNIQFTSGTTGTPKGATLSHHNMLNNGYFTGNAIRLRQGERLCIPVPLYHCFGMVMGNLACLTHGATMVYPSPGFDPISVLQTVESEKCHALYGVPTMFIAVLQHPEFEGFDLYSLRTGIMAGSPCPIEIMRDVVARMHMDEIIIAYGMTETSPVSFAAAPDDPLELRVETIGRVMPHIEAKIIASDGSTAALGEPGEICVRGYSVMLGYWQEPEITRGVVDRDGWMHTGDLGTIDEHGFCRIVGRLKDMIIRGGENIYPREVEEFLYTHPDIEVVSVVGIPDDQFGEEVCAWIKLRADKQMSAEDVRAFCLNTIAHFKIPSIIRFVDSFPMTNTGKVQKFEIRNAMEKERAARIERPV